MEERIVDVLKTVYDPEIPVNIFDLGMIYKIDVRDSNENSLDSQGLQDINGQQDKRDAESHHSESQIVVDVDMTFTAPNCPAADFIMEDVRTKLESVEGVTAANVNLVFEPAWDQSMMSEEARVELGFD